MELYNFLKDKFNINENVLKKINDAELMAQKQFKRINDIKEYNQMKVIHAMQAHNVSDTMFSGTTGYGYDDRGRDVLDQVYATAFNCESAMVRQQIVSGTQALALCMYGVLRPGMTLISATGKPYDTLEEVIGIRGEGQGSLKDFGVEYKQVSLTEAGQPDLAKIQEAVHGVEGMVWIQRSRGYDWRNALLIDDIKEICKVIREVNKDIVIAVDNCYGEFIDYVEPCEVGADLMAGSLIKNPGGGIAPTGGYVAGKEKYVELAANRLTSPGLGAHVGPSLGVNRLFYQGLYMSPHVVAESVKGAVLCGYLMQDLGFEVSPSPDAIRGDLIQAVKFGNPEGEICFCQGIQKGSAVDSFVEPQPWDMPGYDSQVIMAAGAFVQGSSIELSADGPIKEPYIAYMQGGLVYESVKIGLMSAMQKLLDKGLINL